MLPGAGCSREGEAGLQRARQGCVFFFFFFPGPCTWENILKLCLCHSEKCFWLGKMEKELWSRNGALAVSSQGAKLLFRNPPCTWDGNSGTHGLCFNIQLLEYGRSASVVHKTNTFHSRSNKRKVKKMAQESDPCVLLGTDQSQLYPLLLLLPFLASESWILALEQILMSVTSKSCVHSSSSWSPSSLFPNFFLLSSLLLSSLFLGFLHPPLSSLSSLLPPEELINRELNATVPSAVSTSYYYHRKQKCGHLCYDLVNLYT